MSVPPTTSTSTERESHWPFTVEAKVIAVPAPLARLGIGLLVAILLAIAGATCVIVAQIGQVASAIHLLQKVNNEDGQDHEGHK